MAYLDSGGRGGEVFRGEIHLLGQILTDLRLLRGVDGLRRGNRGVTIGRGQGSGRIMDTRRDRNGPIENRDRLLFSSHRLGADSSTVAEKKVIGGRRLRLPSCSGRRGFGVEGGLGNGHHLIMNRRRRFHRGVVGRLCRGERLLVGRVGSGLGVGKTCLRRGDRRGVVRLGSSLRRSPSGLGSSLGRGHGGIGSGHRLVVAVPGELHDRVERIGRDPHARLEATLRSGDVDLELAGGRRHCPDNERRIADVERR